MVSVALAGPVIVTGLLDFPGHHSVESGLSSHHPARRPDNRRLLHTHTGSI